MACLESITFGQPEFTSAASRQECFAAEALSILVNESSCSVLPALPSTDSAQTAKYFGGLRCFAYSP